MRFTLACALEVFENSDDIPLATMRVYVHVCRSICMCTYAYACVCMNRCICTCMNVSMYECAHACMHDTCVSMRACTYAPMCV